ncbi:MAG: hypothetical protein H0W72_04680 [Planctomycetes bacterium]|nr:hypothetical protein [Planctomycetota bacterium]
MALAAFGVIGAASLGTARSAKADPQALAVDQVDATPSSARETRAEPISAPVTDAGPGADRPVADRLVLAGDTLASAASVSPASATAGGTKNGNRAAEPQSDPGSAERVPTRNDAAGDALRALDRALGSGGDRSPPGFNAPANVPGGSQVLGAPPAGVG